MSAFNEGHLTATYPKDAKCPHCQADVVVVIEFDRGVAALTTVLSGFYETPRDFDFEACVDEGLEELSKRTNVQLERRPCQ